VVRHLRLLVVVLVEVGCAETAAGDERSWVEMSRIRGTSPSRPGISLKDRRDGGST
jgi:hypothetical protein